MEKSGYQPDLTASQLPTIKFNKITPPVTMVRAVRNPPKNIRARFREMEFAKIPGKWFFVIAAFINFQLLRQYKDNVWAP